MNIKRFNLKRNALDKKQFFANFIVSYGNEELLYRYSSEWHKAEPDENSKIEHELIEKRILKKMENFISSKGYIKFMNR